MLSSISPLGERARGQRYGVTIGAYLAGSALGGGLLGAVLGGLGQLLAHALGGRGAGAVPAPGIRERVVLLLLAAAAAAAATADGNGRRLPGPRRQVDERWLHAYRGWVYGGGFGLQLGAGIVTIVSTAALPLLWLIELLSGSLLIGAVLGLVFGLTRALPLLAGVRSTTPAALRRTQARMVSASRAARSSTVAVCALVAAGAAVVGLVA